MNRIHRIGLLVLLLVGMVLPACKKEKSYEGGYDPNGSADWSFSQDIHAYNGPIDTAYYQNNGSVNSLVLEGVSSTSSQDNFYLEIIGANIITGSYSTPSVVFEYYSGGKLLYGNDPAANDKFTVTVTSIDSAQVTGTFTGEVKDTTGTVIVVTNGKFTARIGKSDGQPPVNNTACHISNVATYDLATGDKQEAVATTFSGNQAVKTEVIDSSSQTGGTVISTFNLVYAATQINVDASQFFTLDGNGRIASYSGHFNPTDNTTPELVITYSYDANGYMTKASAALKAFPALEIAQSEYTWTSGNLTQVKVTGSLLPNGYLLTYEYDGNQQAKEFLAFHPNPEILLFQNAINYGKGNANLPVRSTHTDIDAGGNPTGTPVVAEFKNYVFDANGYVTSFESAGGESVYGTNAKNVLTYICH